MSYILYFTITILGFLCVVECVNSNKRRKENEVRRWVSHAVRAAEEKLNGTTATTEDKLNYVYKFLSSEDLVPAGWLNRVTVLIYSEANKNGFNWR